MVNESPSKKAFKAQTRFQAASKKAEKSFLEVGKEAAAIWDNNYWQDLGYTSFDSFIQDPENTSLSYGQIYRCKNVYMFFVQQHDIEEKLLIDAGVYKLERLQQSLKKRNEHSGIVEDWVVTCANNSWSAVDEMLIDDYAEEGVEPYGKPYNGVGGGSGNGGDYGGGSQVNILVNAMGRLLELYLNDKPERADHPVVKTAKSLIHNINRT
jgi:hypothetical protein